MSRAGLMRFSQTASQQRSYESCERRILYEDFFYIINKQTTKKQNRNTCLKGITQPKKVLSSFTDPHVYEV